MSTCPLNTNKHPGHEQNKYSLTRRSPAEVAAERAAKKAAKAEQAVQIEAGLKEVAEIEHQTQQKQKRGHYSFFKHSYPLQASQETTSRCTTRDDC